MAAVEQQWQDDSQWWSDEQWGNDGQWICSMSKKVQKTSPHAALRLWGVPVTQPRVDAVTEKAEAQSGDSTATAAAARHVHTSPAAAAAVQQERRTLNSTNRFAILADTWEYEAETSKEVDIQELIKRKPERRKRGRKPRQCNTADAKNRHMIEVKNEDELDDIIKEMMEQQAEASTNAKIDEIIHSSQVSEQISLENEMAKKLGRMIAGLSIKKESLSPCTKKETEWTKLSLVVDSGACESVIDAAEQLPGYPIMETKASRSGLTYASATGEDILNLGEVRVPMMTREGTKRSMKLQAAEVARPLASVKRICEAGHTVIFDEEGSYIINKGTGEINYLREDSGNYMFDVWIPPNSSVPNFQRP
jgi:hypothetical protein